MFLLTNLFSYSSAFKQAMCIVQRIISVKGSFNSDADPYPGSALEKMDPDPDHEHFLRYNAFFDQ